MRITTRALAGTTILAALVVVFDYTLKYSGMKIPFPWFPFLKFDFTGIPIVLSLLFFGLVPGFFTSAVAFVAILSRSGDFVGSSMKSLAEFSTVFGIFLGLKMVKRFRLFASFSFGIASRVMLMMCVNLALIYTGLILVPQSYSEIPLVVVLFTGVFNVIQGTISVIGGYLIYRVITERVPSVSENM